MLMWKYSGLRGMITWINKILMCLADVDITIVWLVDFSCV